MNNSTLRKRKPRTPRNNSRNPNYKLLREKLARKRTMRQKKRVADGKKTLAMPLEMVTGAMQKQACREGKLLLRDGEKIVSIPLVTFVNENKAYLQGIYKLSSGELVVLRSLPFLNKPVLQYFIRKNGSEATVISFFDRLKDFTHDLLEDEKLEGRGLGSKAAVKAEKEYRAIGGRQPVYVPEELQKFYAKMHWKPLPNQELDARFKSSKTNPNDDMRTNHVIEAINPVTGKIITYSFPIKK